EAKKGLMSTGSTNSAADSNRAGRSGPNDRWDLAQKPLIRYAIALVAVAVAWLARALFSPLLGAEAAYLFFTPAVLVAAGIGGLGPGLVATAFATVLGFLISMAGSNSLAAEVTNAVIFALIGGGIAWGGEQLRRSRTQASTSALDASAREAHLQSILDTVPDAMIVIDERGIIQSFSSAAERLFGCTTAEVLGANVK